LRKSQALSESIHRENSFLLDSYLDEKPNTNGSHSKEKLLGGRKK
jgi:hypothetical protein